MLVKMIVVMKLQIIKIKMNQLIQSHSIVQMTRVIISCLQHDQLVEEFINE